MFSPAREDSGGVGVNVLSISTFDSVEKKMQGIPPLQIKHSLGLGRGDHSSNIVTPDTPYYGEGGGGLRGLVCPLSHRREAEPREDMHKGTAPLH